MANSVGDGGRIVLGGEPARMFTRRHHRYLAESLNYTAKTMLDEGTAGEYIPGLAASAPLVRSTAAYVIRGVVERLATAMRRDNPSFDEKLFVDECLKEWW